MGRRATVTRTTKETSIEVRLDLDGSGALDVETPLPFLTHMVEQLGKHGLFDVFVRAKGDVEIDGHHTTEDLAMCIGACVEKALGDKKGIARYGWATLPMDEARVTCALDLGGRAFYVGEVDMPKAKLGTWDTELLDVFMEGFARGGNANVHLVKHAGSNLHHVVEVSFKALAKALSAAVRVDPRGALPSTKGVI